MIGFVVGSIEGRVSVDYLHPSSDPVRVFICIDSVVGKIILF